MEVWDKRTVKSLLLPGGALLAASVMVLEGKLLPISAAASDSFYFAVFGAGILLAWRFHTSRVLFATISILLAHRAIEFFSAGRVSSLGPGRIALEAIAFLLPVNFMVASLVRERGLTIHWASSHAVILFCESVLLAVICRPGSVHGPALLHASLLWRALFLWTTLPQLGVLSFGVGFGVLLLRFLSYRQPLGSGLLWALAAAFLSLQAGGVGRVADAYMATAGLILLASILEDSYVLAYYDELTRLPSRRAYKEALLRLVEPYTIASVDIDHFKSFNDTYGHETGDQVLRLVAGKLAGVAGGGTAFRVGGEEFSILFSATTTREVVEHLEGLRRAIAEAAFHVRATPERREAPVRNADRRAASRRRAQRTPMPPAEQTLSVTVSIGVAESKANKGAVEQVIEAADRALYKAKREGRNRVEVAGRRGARGANVGRITA